jgi:hypothetical protein
MAERKQALDAWASHVEQITSNPFVQADLWKRSCGS